MTPIIIAFALTYILYLLYKAYQKRRTLERQLLAEYQALSGTTDLELETDKGVQGELAIYRTIRRMDLGGYVLVNLYIPHKGAMSEVDVVWVHETGIYVIESKNYSGKVYGFENARNWSQYLGGKKYPFYNPIEQNKTHIRALAGTGLDPKHLHSYIVFGSGAVLQKVTVSKDAPPVVLLPEMAKRLGKEARKRKPVYTEQDVYTIANGLWQEYGLASDEVKNAHVDRLQKKYGTTG